MTIYLKDHSVQIDNSGTSNIIQGNKRLSLVSSHQTNRIRTPRNLVPRLHSRPNHPSLRDPNDTGLKRTTGASTSTSARYILGLVVEPPKTAAATTARRDRASTEAPGPR